MALELTLDYRMRWMDFDRYGRMQPWAVLDLLQDTATAHAVELGIGRDSMVPQGVFWAIIRMRYEVEREPKHHQAVTVRTWPHSLSKFSFIRDFTISDEAGDLLVKASSEWVLMDVEARKFASVKDHYAGPTDFCEDRVFPKKPRKLPAFEVDDGPARVVVPAYSDIDVNGHVNNAMYARFVVDALDPGAQGTVRAFQMDYRQEVLVGAPLSIYTHVEGGKAYAKGLREDGETSFACLIEF